MKKKIQIKSETGEDIAVEIGDSDTLTDLKQKIFDSQGIDPEIQRFIFDGAQLVDNEVVVVDQIDAILANKPHSASSIEDDRTVNVTVWMALPLREGKESDQRVGDGEQFKLSGRRLQIHIKSVANREIPVEIAPTDTVDDVKQKIFEKEKVVPDDQRLLFGNLIIADGIVFDQVIAVLDRQPHWANSVVSEAAPRGPNTGTLHVTIIMVQRLRGGANTVFHKVQMQSSSSDSDCEGDGNNVSNEVLGQRSRPSMPGSSNASNNLQKRKKDNSARCCCFGSFCCR